LTQPIVIVGAGPVGLSLALALTQKGRKVRLIDSKNALGTDPRANTWHPPTLAMMQEWGVLDEMLKQGQRVERLQYWNWDARALLVELSYDLIANETSFPYRINIPQHLVCQILLDRLEKSELAEIQFGRRLVDCANVDGHVQARIGTGDVIEEIDTPFLVGADGTNSTVRALLRLGYYGKTYEDRFLTFEMGFDFDESSGSTPLGPVGYLMSKTQWALMMPMRDCLRVLVRITNARNLEKQAEAEALKGRVALLLGTNFDFKFRNRGIYMVHNRVVDRMRIGQILLAGDSAHGINPVGGTAMNVGIHDAHHLARALDQALEGHPASLDGYDQQRRIDISNRVQLNAEEAYQVLCARGDYGEQARDRYLRRLERDEDLARDHMLRLSLLDSLTAGDDVPLLE